ncbi:GyrI-like domain-containing protein [Mangrovibacterium lignilyticum]|uniref:GyrI-like domain-containing protein n=1 Tax=Mangrovibacterium lignilyticum TaxID=2668052 RepID=UPI0013D7EEA1|nr:GyrI-like domain-containing protein [Mangrovibacterium lignilyticum]
MLEYRIENLAEKKLVGCHRRMSYAANQTAELWKSFMPRRKEIKHAVGPDLFSVQYYQPGFFHTFQPETTFDTWATMAVSDYGQIPEGMVKLPLAGGLYAVFRYKGLPGEAAPAFQWIMGEWLPASDYELDDRLHFEILGENYRNDHPDSEEEIWIPIRKR